MDSNSSKIRGMVNNTVLNNRTMELVTHSVKINTRRHKIKDITKATNNRIWECSNNNLTNNRTPNYLVKVHSMLLEGNRLSR